MVKLLKTKEWENAKMERLLVSWSDVNNETRIAQCFRAILASGGKLESDIVRSFHKTNGPYGVMASVHRNYWHLIFDKDHKFHYINKKSREFLKTL